MFQIKTTPTLPHPELVRSLLTGTLMTKESEAFRHEREVEFFSSLSPRGLEDILTGCSGKNCHRSVTAVRGPVEVEFLRSEIALYRSFTQADTRNCGCRMPH